MARALATMCYPSKFFGKRWSLSSMKYLCDKYPSARVDSKKLVLMVQEMPKGYDTGVRFLALSTFRLFKGLDNSKRINIKQKD
ncbi:MAG: hypothetical protein WCJ19_04410 [bacterium]